MIHHCQNPAVVEQPLRICRTLTAGKEAITVSIDTAAYSPLDHLRCALSQMTFSDLRRFVVGSKSSRQLTMLLINALICLGVYYFAPLRHRADRHDAGSAPPDASVATLAPACSPNQQTLPLTILNDHQPDQASSPLLWHHKFFNSAFVGALAVMPGGLTSDTDLHLPRPAVVAVTYHHASCLSVSAPSASVYHLQQRYTAMTTRSAMYAVLTSA